MDRNIQTSCLLDEKKMLCSWKHDSNAHAVEKQGVETHLSGAATGEGVLVVSGIASCVNVSAPDLNICF